MTPQQAIVVLVHGLYMRGFCMLPLARRLRRAGWRTLVFSYPTLARTVADNALALENQVARLDAPVVHFVGHSLGGLVVRYFLACADNPPPGRVVTLATPHQGSQVARAVSAGPLRWIMGRSVEHGLLGDPPPWPAGRELGSLAGTLNVGMGRLLGPVPAPGDGSVAVAETRAPGMADHICLPVSHTGMLIVPAVAMQIHAFLTTGHFHHSGQPP